VAAPEPANHVAPQATADVDPAATAEVRGQAPAAGDHAMPAGPTTASSPGGALATAQAKAKLQMARSQMAQFNYDRAEQLAHEAERLRPNLAAGEDSPKRVLEDLARVRTDPKALLTAARVALGRKDYVHAEQFAQLSEKNSGPFTFPFWGDSPARVLKDVQDLRGRTPTAAAPKAPTAPAKPAAPARDSGVVTASATTPAKAPEPAKPAPGSPEATAQATALLRQARQALAANDLSKARKLNDQARALKPNLHWWEDNPEKVQTEIVRAEQRAKPAVTQVGAKTPATPPAPPAERNKPLTKDEAVALVKKGRALLADNKIDEATQTCLKARASTSLSWGLFEDSPDKLRQDIDKARVKRDRQESVKVLVDARRLYEEGRYDDATKAAYRAQKLHGAYNIWDLGDRPERVLADIQTAKIKIAKGQPVETVKRDTNKRPTETVVKTPPAGSPADQAKARKMLADARAALQTGDAARARTLAAQVQSMHVVLNAPGDDSPEAVLRDAQQTTSGRTAVTVRAPAGEDDKARATRLLVEARELQKVQKLLEARVKIAEAQQLHATFNPGEDTPAAAMEHLAAEARWQVEWFVKEADRVTGTTGPDMAARFKNAENALVQARTLAAGFGFDMRPVEAKLQWVHNQQALARGETPATPVVNGAPKNQGEELLEKARLEIQRGAVESARKLAEEAIQGPYGVQAEAMAVLRSIGAEEANQRRLQSNRTFDAALAAYNRREFANASNLIRAIDANDLDESRRARLREIAMTPEMQPAGRPAVARAPAAGGASPLVQVQASEPGLPSVPAPGTTAVLGEQPGVARAGDQAPADSLLSQTEAMRQVKFQKLRQESLELQRDASDKFRTGQTDAAIDMLQDYLAQLNDAQLELGQVALLRRPVESRLQQFKLLKAQRDFIAEQDGVVKRSHEAKTREVLNEQNKEKKVAELMKQYNTFFQEGKYPEAERLAMQAHELDPDNPMAAAAVSVARTQDRLTKYKKLNEDKDAIVVETLDEADKMGPPGVDANGIVINKEAMLNAEKYSKKYGSTFAATTKSAAMREIEHRLSAMVTLNFTDTPLKSVIDDLRAWQGINIYVDTNALEEDGISLDKPVTIKLEQIPMKSALNLLLHTAHLTWTVRDDVLQITTPRHAKGTLGITTYQVADLIIPVNDYGQFRSPGASPLTTTDVGRVGTPAPTPYTGFRSMGNGDSTGSSTGSSTGGSPFAAEGTPSQPQVTKTGPTNTTEEKLMNLIKGTIQPNSWADSGGPGTIDYFPLSMSLVINQTPDIQEQVYDLLQALRRLQDQEVAVEVRFVTVNDSFFERIGVDFNMNILTKNTRVEPQITSGVFSPDGYINSFQPKNTIIGLQPNGSFTPDLNIPINTQTYTQTLPDFGGYQPIPGFGGLTLGLAFLSDIQVFLFLEAVQGDTRSNVMQAPKLTMFNGQTANLTVTDFQNFVVGAQVVPQMGIFTFQPLVQQFPLGVNLTLQAVISADRRFVRLSIAPTLTNLATQTVNLFPVVVPLITQFDNSSPGGQPVVFTQYIQQPVVDTVAVMTTVAVPDGGTVLMGGLKLLSEERKEYGPPILSKIPYLNRLFKNTSYGRDAQSLLMMVTPRIIIQEEEEEKQTGYIRPVPPTF
jgi:type II secretory pathway component GspD/PulD (secretin)/tetratricopeptide (TPR) repeat protein